MLHYTCHKGHEWTAEWIETKPNWRTEPSDPRCPTCGGHPSRSHTSGESFLAFGGCLDDRAMCEAEEIVRSAEIDANRREFFERH